MKFSANLGLLFTEYDLPDAIRAAKAAGFDAVECHWPYATPSDAIKAALNETGLSMLGLNTPRGDADQGEFGLTALAGREAEAKAAIDQAVAYAKAIDCPKIHVMAGITTHPEAEAVFVENLVYAIQSAPEMMFMIEPINTIDLPGYALSSLDQAERI
ncbi:MAG: isomerase, partial [Alphaproteobacteria bacterium]|nr:isomerase [Alphaproteobacteria bacterium]